jgi:ATP-dependent RNA helicase RhlE
MQDSEQVGSAGFGGLGINDTFMGALAKRKFSVPTPIQLKAIPVALAGEDVIGIAQTGTGKTMAFGVPMLQQLFDRTDPRGRSGNKGIGVVIVPTRELALQVEEALRMLAGHLGVRTAVLIGGERPAKQVAQLRRQPNVVVATPGRLLDMVEQRYLTLDATSILVLDEADRMLDMGFAPQINRILGMIPPAAQRQTLLFSATMPDDIVRIATNHMRMPVRVEVAPAGSTIERVQQELYIVRKENKIDLLREILAQYHGSVLVFSRTKHGARKLCKAVAAMGHRSAEIHANRSLAQRREALDSFKSGRVRVLVATDIAARGIDVTGIELVINFDLPDSSGDYVHRIGRTGRAGMPGHAISLASPDQRADIRDIERLIRKPLPVAKHPSLSVELPNLPPQYRAQQGMGGHRVRRFGNRPRFRRTR